MKYPGIDLKNHNEMHRVCNEKLQWYALGIQWKIAMKCAGYLMKNCNEIPRDIFKKLQWNAQGM